MVLVVLGVGFGGAAWYYADLIEDGGLKIDRDIDYEVRVEGIDGATITLDVQDDDLRPELMGLEWPGGYARADGALAADGEFEVRGYELLLGDLNPGDMVRFDKQAFFDDPLAARGVPYTSVTYESPIGALEAWHIDAAADTPKARAATWMIYVHGKGSDRGAGLRVLLIVRDAGLQSLIISYRNHEASPDDPTGRYQYGLTEWRDLEAATRYALDNGAESIILAGWSMGGSVVASFMYESALAGEVDAIILDSPVLDFEAAVDWGAEQLGVPGVLTAAAKWVADRRFGIDWAGMDYLARADELRVPVLLIHGEEDDTVPISSSRQLAEARPDIVTFLRIPGGLHTSSWNAAPDLYEEGVADFLDSLAE